MSKTLSRAHTRYNIRCRFAWIVKYRKDLPFPQKLAKIVKELIREISERCGFNLDTIATNGNHIHVFAGTPPLPRSARVSRRKMFPSF